MNDKDVLRNLYDNLEFQLVKVKKRKQGSIILDMLKIKSNDRLSLLSDAVEKLSNIDSCIVKELQNNKMIKENELGEYYISARGVWKIESERKEQIEELLDFFDDEYFTNKSIGKSLSDKEKVILLSLIAIRAFSLETALDLKKNDLIIDSCGKVLEYFNEKLTEYNLLKNKVADFLENTGNEHPVSKIIRHTDELPKKTRMIYVNGYKSEQKYFLNLSQNMELNKSDLKFIIQKIFENSQIKYSQIKELIEDLNRIAYRNGPNIFTNMSKSFVQSKFDADISQVIEDAILDL